MRTLDLEENSANLIAPRDLSDDAAIAISKLHQFQVDFPSPVNEEKFIIRPKNIAGLLRISNTLALRIRTRVPVANLFAMLEVVHGLEIPGAHSGVGSLGTIDQLFDVVARILADRVTSLVRKGLYSEYVPRTELGYVVRGRLNARKTLGARMRGDVRVSCSFDSITPDILDNQAILWTLDRIARVGLGAVSALERVRSARRALLGAVTLSEISSEALTNRSYNRLNEDYRVIHALCRFVLEATGPHLSSGEHQFIPFTVNMWSLFQEYMVATIRAGLPRDLEVRRQYAVSLGDAVKFYIDAVIMREGKVLAVVDAKYTRDLQPESEDVHQTIAYASYTGAAIAVLVYPTEWPLWDVMTCSGIRLCCIGLPLDQDLALAREKFCRELVSLLLRT